MPFVEDGTLILIGATTENPYFEVNSALISRSSVFELSALTKEDIKVLLKRAVYDEELISMTMRWSFWLTLQGEMQEMR